MRSQPNCFEVVLLLLLLLFLLSLSLLTLYFLLLLSLKLMLLFRQHERLIWDSLWWKLSLGGGWWWGGVGVQIGRVIRKWFYFYLFIYYSIATPLLAQGCGGSQLRITWLVLFSINIDLVFKFSLNLRNICFCSDIVPLYIFSYFTSILLKFKSVHS